MIDPELETFLSKVTHDVNNVLMSIAPWADVLKRRYGNDPTLQKAAEAIAEAVASGRRVTDEIRQFRGK